MSQFSDVKINAKPYKFTFKYCSELDSLVNILQKSYQEIRCKIGLCLHNVICDNDKYKEEDSQR